MLFGLTDLIRKFIQGTRDAEEKGKNKKQEKIRKKEEKNLDKATKEYQQQDPTLELKPEEVSSELEEALRKALDEHEKQEASFQSVIAQNQGFTPEQINYPDDTEDLVKKYTKENGGELNADIATLRNTGYLMRGQAQNTQMLQMTGNTVTAMAQNMGTMNQAQSAFLENAPQTFQNMVDRNTENLNAVLREFDEKERRRAKFWGAIKSGIMLGPTLMTTTLSAAEKLRVQTENFKQFVGQALGTLMGAKGIFNQLADSIPWLGKIRDKIYTLAELPKVAMEWLPKRLKHLEFSIIGGLGYTLKNVKIGETRPFYDILPKGVKEKADDYAILYGTHGESLADLNKQSQVLESGLDVLTDDKQRKSLYEKIGLSEDDILSDPNLAYDKIKNARKNQGHLSIQRAMKHIESFLSEVPDQKGPRRKVRKSLERILAMYKRDPSWFLTGTMNGGVHPLLNFQGYYQNVYDNISQLPDEDQKAVSDHLYFLNTLYTSIKKEMDQPGGASKLNQETLGDMAVLALHADSESGMSAAESQALELLQINEGSVRHAQRELKEMLENTNQKITEANKKLSDEGREEIYNAEYTSTGMWKRAEEKAEKSIARDKKIMEDIGIPDSTMESSDIWMHKVCEKYGVPFATALNLQKTEKDPNKRPFGWTEQTIWINDSVWKSVWGKNTNSDSMDLMKVGNPCYTGKGRDKKFVGNLNEWGVGGALKIKENEYTTPKPTTATSISRTESTPASTASDIDWDEKYDEYLQATDHSQQYANSQFEESEGAHKRYLIELIQQELSQYGEPIPEDLSPEALNNYTILELDKLLTDIQANGSEYLLRRRKAINNIDFYRTNGLFRGMKNAGGISLDTESVSAFIRRSNLDQIESFSRSLALAYGSFMDKRDEARAEGKQYEAYIKQQKEAEALDDDLMMEEYYRKLAHDASSEGEGNEVRDIYNDENMKRARKQHIYEMQHVGEFTKEERQANIDRWNAEHAEEQRKMDESLEKWHTAVDFDGTESVIDNLWDSYKLRLNRYKAITGNEYLNSAELASMEARIKGRATSAVKIQTIQAYNQTIDNAILNAESVLESQIVGKLHKRQSTQSSSDTEESSNLNEEIRLALEILGKTEAQILDEIRTKSGTTVNVTTANNTNTTPQLPGSQYEDQEN